MPIWTAEIKELEKLYESFKGQLPELEKELGKLIKADDENMIFLYSRRCLEVIITDLCECELNRPRKTEPLKGIIDKLQHEEKIPSHIITSMHNLNSLSTYGAHPKDFDSEQIKLVLVNLDIIIKWYLKYKDSKINITVESEEAIDKINLADDITEQTQKPKKRRILLLSGLTLVVAFVVVSLFVFNIIGGGSRIKELEKSIAVLPFINDSPDSTNQYFCNGMMDEILTQLQKIGKLQVKSRISGERYRNPNKDIKEIGRELHASFIVEGSVRKVNDDLRITVQLINSKTGNHLWAENYDGKYSDRIFEFTRNIAKMVASSLNAILTIDEKQLINKNPTSNLSAYDLYLRANNYLEDYQKKRDVDSYQNANTFYNAALLIDPSFANAYTGLANLYFTKEVGGETFFEENYLDTVLFLVDKSLSFDDKLEDAYYLKGLYFRSNGDFDEALKNFDIALKINPNYYKVYTAKGNILTWYSIDFIKCIDNYNKALTLCSNDDRPSLLRYLAGTYLNIGFPEKAKYFNDEAYSLDSNKLVNLHNHAALAFFEEKFDEGVNILREIAGKADTSNLLIMLAPPDEAYLYAKKLEEKYKKSGTLNLNESHRIGYAYYRAGKKDEAKNYFDRQIKYCDESIKNKTMYFKSNSAQYDLAATYAFLDDKDNAYKYLNEFRKKSNLSKWWVLMLKYDPLFDNIRKEEPFQNILLNIEAKYQAEHERVKKWLEENNML